MRCLIIILILFTSCFGVAKKSGELDHDQNLFNIESVFGVWLTNSNSPSTALLLSDTIYRDSRLLLENIKEIKGQFIGTIYHFSGERQVEAYEAFLVKEAEKLKWYEVYITGNNMYEIADSGIVSMKNEILYFDFYEEVEFIRDHGSIKEKDPTLVLLEALGRL